MDFVSKLFMFVKTGLLTAAIYFLLYIGILPYATPVIATSIASVVAICISYVFASRFIFVGQNGSFIKFLFIAAFGGISNVLWIYLLTAVLHTHEIIAGILVVIIVPLTNFTLNYFFNFKEW